MAQLTLPNGKTVTIPDNWPEQDKENYLLKLQQDEQYQFVCSLAGLEYDYVYRIYKNILEDDGIDPVDMLKRFMKN